MSKKGDGLRFSGIYVIVNAVDGKRYVGSSARLNRRWNEHRLRLRKGTHHSRHLQAAWAKYGESAFSYTVIEFCAPEDLLAREQHYLDEGSPYNVEPVAGSACGRQFSQETIQRQRAAAKLRCSDPAYRERISQSVRRVMADPAFRQRLSVIQKERFERPGQREKLSAAVTKVMLNPEMRARLSRAGKIAQANPELRERLAATRATPEYKEKLSAAITESHKRRRAS